MNLGLRAVAKFLLLLTSVVMYAVLDSLHASGGVLTSMAIAALLVFVAILLHELAHAAAAYLVGARVHAIVALPLRLRLHPPRLDLIRRGGRGDLGGYVSFTLDRIAARRKHAIIAAAGPLANLGLALLAVTMAPYAENPARAKAIAEARERAAALMPAAVPTPEYGPVDDVSDRGTTTLGLVPSRPTPSLWPILLLAFGLLSGGLGIANLIPYDGSDGAQLLRLWRAARRR